MPLLKEIVPQDYQTREYLKPLLDREQAEALPEVFKKLDNAETLIGKRPAIPGRDAKPEELDKFFEQWRPDKPEEYDIPVEKDAKVDQTYLKAVREAFHAGKISKVQAQGFLTKIGEFGAAQRKAKAEAQAKADAEFDTLVKVGLGEQNKVVMERVRKAIADHAPAAYKGQLDRLDDKNLVLMAGVIDSIMRKYMSEDELKGKGKGTAGSGGNGSTAKEKQEEARKLMGSKAYSNWQDPEHESTVAKVNGLYKEIAELRAV